MAAASNSNGQIDIGSEGIRSQNIGESSALLVSDNGEPTGSSLPANEGLDGEDTHALLGPAMSRGEDRNEEASVNDVTVTSPQGARAFGTRLAMGTVGLAVLCFVLASRWIWQLGGLSPSLRVTNKTVFNWHPILMIASFLSMTVGSLAFRLSSLLSDQRDRGEVLSTQLLLRHERADRRRRGAKLVHAGSWCVAAVCMGAAVAAVFQSHNNPDKPVANLYSLHSWVGLLVLLSYAVQLAVGLLVFYNWMPVSAANKARILKIHKTAGPIVYLCTAVTILLGIQEKEGFVGCSYQVAAPDTVPFRHVFQIPSACWTSHILGLMVALVAILTAALWFTTSSPGVEDRQRRSR
jgi:cytochrome b561